MTIMKKSILLIALLILTHFSYAQITKSKSKLSPDLEKLIPGRIVPAPSVPSSGDQVSTDYLAYDANGNILVSIIPESSTSMLISELNSAKIRVKSSAKHSVTVSLPAVELGKLESIKQARKVRPVYKPIVDNTVISQGDAGLKANLARSTFGVNGSGIKVGVLSDSYDNLNGAALGISTGNLPGPGNPNGFTTPVQVIEDIPSGGSDEGRAMIEIIHDLAPGAQQLFATAVNGQPSFAANIIALKDAGCKVIVDDVRYFDEPFFQDGVIAQAVNTVAAAGVTYFASAGNYGNQSYENSYRAGVYNYPDEGNIDVHNFAAAGNPDVFWIPLTLAPGSYTFILQWDEPFPSVSGGAGAQTDLDLYYGINGSTATFSAAFDNLGGDPLEILQLNVAGGTRYLMINKFAGPNPGRLKIVIRGGNLSFSNNTIPGQGMATGYGHSSANGAIAAAAAPFNKTPAFGVDPPVLESFSSKGDITILFDENGNRLASPITRAKPDLTAIDGANTSFFGSDSNNDADALPNFFGTSAAAPHAAAVAALMLQSRNGQPFTPSQMKAAMQNSCIDMDDPDLPGFQVGFDNRTGSGLLQADVAVGKVVCDFTPNPQYTPICLVGNTLSLSASGGGSYSWKGPNGFSSASATPAPKKSKAADVGIYSVTVTNSNSCTASATVEVYFGAGAISASSNSPVCKGSTINLLASATHGVSYKWTKLGSTKVWLGATPSIANAKTSNAGLYIVWITGDNGCISKEEVLVSVITCPGTRLASDEAEEIDMEINAYPNPVTNTLTVEVTLKEPSTLKLQLFNSIGNESGTWQLNEESTVHKTELNMGELTGGVYLLQAQAGKQKAVKRVVKIQY